VSCQCSSEADARWPEHPTGWQPGTGRAARAGVAWPSYPTINSRKPSRAAGPICDRPNAPQDEGRASDEGCRTVRSCFWRHDVRAVCDQTRFATDVDGMVAYHLGQSQRSWSITKEESCQ
jgi:hypothetical protein